MISVLGQNQNKTTKKQQQQKQVCFQLHARIAFYYQICA